MALIEWTEEFEVGVPTLDEQHRNLIEIVNRFDDARRRGKGNRIMTEILNEILGYTQEHFAYEEKLMRESEYEDLAAHQGQHRQLLQKIERLQFEYAEKRQRITSEMGELFRYWITSHILQHDQGYAECLRESELKT